MIRPNGTKNARIIQVIETKAIKGLGIERDPVRDVTQYWDFDGNLLAEFDPDPQYISDYSVWESNRLKNIINDLKLTREPQNK